MSRVDGAATIDGFHLGRGRTRVVTAPNGPSPACLGGSHRRCLLDETTCSCAHHLADYLTPVPPVVRDVFPCPICDALLDTTTARTAHVASEHPVKVTNDHWWGCFYCHRKFETEMGRTQHHRREHAIEVAS